MIFTDKGEYKSCPNESRGHDGNQPMDFVFGGPSVHEQAYWK